MGSAEFTIRDDGLAFFPELEDSFGVPNAVTYDNDLWGNMNPYHSLSEEDKLRIAKNDRIIAKQMGVDHIMPLTTPPEDTFMHLERDSYEYLRLMSAKKNDPFTETLLKANAVVVDDSIERAFELVIAPADCATLLFVHPEWDGFIFMHVGSPQVIQKLDLKVLSYAQAAYPEMDMSKMKVFVSPYICMDHYSIAPDKFRKEKGDDPLKQAEIIFGKGNVKAGDHGVYRGQRIYVNFMATLKNRLKEIFGISDFVESGICNYESAQEGKLFSNELTQELIEMQKSDPEITLDKAVGTFNVVVTYLPHTH